MGAKFEIRSTHTRGKGKRLKYFVFARLLDPKTNFKITGNGRLNDVEITDYRALIRVVDKEGNPIPGIIEFKIRYRKDCDKLTEGDIVELILDED